ncbi:sugar phosphate isomerase/epimerase family protein [Spiribacter halobius]|uniref:Sugar phosphate isomerase/epimerase n=1 Tax=Sediminicurvatus halobius TaxID=2182432 RepID=A0A2U2N175_9GAMM|nr:sugar phosphate isomerase/epimerase family protein [Spiribacter halobius]PWG62797.1 sugar phosphate isomerase/epimerase [Spiribacter halobius]UEX77056.1 sugar phosphate isomerase/epimerase [Spiribacter halobius]
MAEFGAHAFIWESDWNPASARRVIAGAAAAGLDFVEIPLLRPESMDTAGTRRLLAEHRLGVRCSLGLPPAASLPAHPQAAEAFLCRALDVTRALGGPVLTGVIYGTLGQLPGHPPRPGDLDIVAQTLRRVAAYAADQGLALGIEPVNRYETHLVNLTDQALELLDAIGADNVFLHLDTYHMNVEEKGFRGPVEAAGKRLRYIHLSESDRGTPGTGNVHWDEVFDGLAAIGYRGDLVMESFAAVNEDIARATCIWRQVAPDPDTLVREGLAFLRGKATARGLIP